MMGAVCVPPASLKLIMLRIYKPLLFLAILAVASTAIAQTAAKAPKSKLFDANKLIEDVRILSADEMGGRSADAPGIEKARDYIEKRYRESGIKDLFGFGYRQGFRIERSGKSPIRAINFVGQIKGKKRSDKYIVITAHYDHLGMRNGSVFNGADDNASGTAALFAIATYFAKNSPEHTLIFAAFDAEEMGLLGAKEFVANPPVAKENILLNINMDMISRSDKGELYAAGTYHYPQFKPALEAAQKKAKVKLLLGHDRPELGMGDWTNQSDHAAFHAAKIPFIYFGVEDHKDYHRPTDDFANIQPEFYVRAVETIIEAIREFDRAGATSK